MRLNGYCSPGDECGDVNAVCRRGVCICQHGYYDNGRDACGTWHYVHVASIMLVDISRYLIGIQSSHNDSSPINGVDLS